MSVTRKRRVRRGYMLLEALIGSALLASTLVGVYQHLGFMQRQVEEAVKRKEASAALQEGINRYRAISYGAAAPGVVTDVPPGTVSRIITVTAVSGSACRDCRRVEVLVTYASPAARANRTLRQMSLVAP